MRITEWRGLSAVSAASIIVETGEITILVLVIRYTVYLLFTCFTTYDSDYKTIRYGILGIWK